MTIFAQHGFGKGSKVDNGIEEGIIGGVILSPRDERPDELPLLLDRWNGLADSDTELTILMDPQLYASTIDGAQVRHLDKYSFYPGHLSRRSFTSTRRVQRLTREIVDYQLEIPLTAVIAPTVAMDSFSGFWSGVALTLLDESVVRIGSASRDRDVLGSLLIDESAFVSDRRGLNVLLDDLTAIDVDGYYIVVSRHSANYPSVMNEDAISSLMYLVYVLAVVNDYTVIVGFADFDGVLMCAVGATAMATGWYSNLRQFSSRRWLGPSGGRQPRARYTSEELLNSLIKDVELQAVFDVNEIASVVVGDAWDSEFLSRDPGEVIWQRERACLQHWWALGNLVERFRTGRGAACNLTAVQGAVIDALASFDVLESLGVRFESPIGQRRLRAWTNAIRIFRSEAGV